MRYGTNDQMSPRIYPWWLILVGFVFGVIVTLIVTAARPQQSTIIYQPYDNQEMQSFEMTATGILREATMNAQAFNNQMALPTEIDPMSATAAALNEQIALGDRLSPMDDPIFLTATAIVIQATQQAPPQ